MQQGFAQGPAQSIGKGIERGMASGIERGMERGLEQGRVEGERAVLERLLARRFGRLPAATAERLEGASADDLRSWSENVLDAERLDGVFGGDS